MPSIEVRQPDGFPAGLKDVLKKFSNSKEFILEEIINICSEPNSGEWCPGYGNHKVHKNRIPLKKYRMSQSEGLRLFRAIYDQFAIPLFIYKKGDVSEIKAVEMVRERLNILNSNPNLLLPPKLDES
ncbi:MAG: hypothetical protein PHW04_04835 [Candidatus Wallbacteria bacterium]|nr:hypothetical protein [Candidatus Wallbacteria bacterium]